MGDWSMLEGQLVDTVGEVTAQSLGTLVTAGNQNNKGTWAQLIAATTYTADGLLIFFHTGYLGFLVDIGIGASGSEEVIVSNLHYSQGIGSVGYDVYFIPIAIPAETRIAARCQSSGGSAYTIRVTISLISQGFLPSASLSRATTYGAATADSGGVSVDPGGTVHTKGAYSQINAATAAPIRALVVGIGNQDNQAMAIAYWLVDIAIGAAGSEQIIIPDILLTSHTTSDEIRPAIIGPFFIDIPAGVRLAARAQCNINDATDRKFDIVLYGID